LSVAYDRYAVTSAPLFPGGTKWSAFTLFVSMSHLTFSRTSLGNEIFLFVPSSQIFQMPS
jgi:hypothetical protein